MIQDTNISFLPKLNIELWTYLTPCSSVSIVNFEQVNAGWVESKWHSSSHIWNFQLTVFFSDNIEFLFHEQSKKQKESKIQAYSIQIILTAVLP